MRDFSLVKVSASWMRMNKGTRIVDRFEDSVNGGSASSSLVGWTTNAPPQTSQALLGSECDDGMRPQHQRPWQGDVLLIFWRRAGWNPSRDSREAGYRPQATLIIEGKDGTPGCWSNLHTSIIITMWA
jgi:hypothetical protein